MSTSNEPLFIGKLAFLNKVTFLINSIIKDSRFQWVLFLACLAYMAHVDFSTNGSLDGQSIYLGGPIGVGIGAWLIRKKNGNSFLREFLPSATLCAFVMLLATLSN